MARILVTGAADGLGRGCAQLLINMGHDVLVHALSVERAEEAFGIGEAGVVIGDLSRRDETVAVAEQVNARGSLDAIVHNAAVYDARRVVTADGYSRTLAVNVLAPFIVTALVARPCRLVYLSSDMHFGVAPSLDDIDWTARVWQSDQAYAESKFHVTALALALARRWPDARSNAVDPGWVRTRMGGPSAPGDLVSGCETQAWLATGEGEAGQATGGYWHCRRRQSPAAGTRDPQVQDDLLAELSAIADVPLP